MAVKEKCLTIRLTRLPDIHSEQAVASHGLLRYGRFAVTRGGGFWFAQTISSHPTNTQVGWYWAVNAAGELLVSARGAGIDGEALFSTHKPVLAQLIDQLVKLRCIDKPRAIRVVT